MNNIPEKFQKAVELIFLSNSCKASFNVPVKDSYNSVHVILIHESNCSLIDNLIENGYNLSMCEKGLSVDKF